MPTSHAAVRHGVSWSKARRAELAFLAEWDHTRPKRRPRRLGLDEIQRGKGQRFWTVRSDIVHGEVIGLRHDRTETTATTLLVTDLTARQRAAVTAVCTDMHRPYLNAVAQALSHAEVVFDKFTCCSTPAPRSMKSAAKSFPSRGGDAEAWSRETLAVAAAVEDGPWIEAPGIADAVRGESPPV